MIRYTPEPHQNLTTPEPSSKGSAPVPYIDTNSSPFIVDVQLKTWRELPSSLKNLLIKEKLINTRNTKEIDLIKKIKTNKTN